MDLEGETLFKYLCLSRVDEDILMGILIPRLLVMGARKIDDLEHVERDDLNIKGKAVLIVFVN